MAKSFYLPGEAAEIANVTVRQLVYWDRINFVRPSYRRRGKYRLYTFFDLVLLTIAAKLRESRSIQKIVPILKNVRTLFAQAEKPIVELTVFTCGNRVLVFNGETLISGVTKEQCFRFKVSEIRERIEGLFPTLGSENFPSLGRRK